MAQWKGQFSGNTHETRAHDAEAALRLAAATFREAGSVGERERAAKQVCNLADRLLTARLQLLKSRIAKASEPRMTGLSSAWGDGIDALRARETQAKSDGVRGILEEFDAIDAQT